LKISNNNNKSKKTMSIVSKLSELGALPSKEKKAFESFTTDECLQSFEKLCCLYDPALAATSSSSVSELQRKKNLLRQLRQLDVGHLLKDANDIQANNKHLQRTMQLLFDKLKSQHGNAILNPIFQQKQYSAATTQQQQRNRENQPPLIVEKRARAAAEIDAPPPTRRTLVNTPPGQVPASIQNAKLAEETRLQQTAAKRAVTKRSPPIRPPTAAAGSSSDLTTTMNVTELLSQQQQQQASSALPSTVSTFGLNSKRQTIQNSPPISSSAATATTDAQTTTATTTTKRARKTGANRIHGDPSELDAGFRQTKQIRRSPIAGVDDYNNATTKLAASGPVATMAIITAPPTTTTTMTTTTTTTINSFAAPPPLPQPMIPSSFASEPLASSPSTIVTRAALGAVQIATPKPRHPLAQVAVVLYFRSRNDA
jgi:hypothetical protein